MQAFWDHVLNFSKTSTTEVGARLLDAFGTSQAKEKSDGSLITECDEWSDERLRTLIHQEFPEHGVLSEEALHTFPDAEWCWIIDPIDGTTNFTRGIPVWGISLGLLYRGVPVFGYVAMTPLNQHFYGFWPGDSGLQMPKGAFLNQQPIQVSQAAPAQNQFFSLCARSTVVMAKPFPCKIRMLGSAAYNLLTVAAGVTLGAMEATPKIWDIAAVWAIVQAAGGQWVALDDLLPFPLVVGENYRQRPYPTLAVSQAKWIEQFRSLVQPVVK